MKHQAGHAFSSIEKTVLGSRMLLVVYVFIKFQNSPLAVHSNSSSSD